LSQSRIIRRIGTAGLYRHGYVLPDPCKGFRHLVVTGKHLVFAGLKYSSHPCSVKGGEITGTTFVFQDGFNRYFWAAMFLENTINRGRRHGWIEVICGSMFSGKTEELIRRLKRAEFAKMKVEIFKPMVDVRYSEEAVVSHDENTIRSTPIQHSSQLLLMTTDVEVVGIDEAQFFDEGLPEVCNQLANQGIRVVVAGLDMDYLGRPFGPMPNLLAIAEFVTKVHAICVKTGNLAQYSYRVTGDNELVHLGEKESYLPLSREAYNEEMKKRKEEK
jgi:thymidine kinase